jgi:hypothetical protein
MKLIITDNHDGEGNFPVFPKGTAVENIEPCEEFLHWMACSIDNVETFVPDVCVADGKLTEDYDPTEVVLAKGEIVELQRIVFEWLYVKTSAGISGWLPANKAVSVHE